MFVTLRMHYVYAHTTVYLYADAWECKRLSSGLIFLNILFMHFLKMACLHGRLYDAEFIFVREQTGQTRFCGTFAPSYKDSQYRHSKQAFLGLLLASLVDQWGANE